MVRTPVQTNHMCDCPNHLHIDVVGTARSLSKGFIKSFESAKKKNYLAKASILF